MLESYFVRPETVDRIRASWIGAEVERYVGWLAEHGYAARCVLSGAVADRVWRVRQGAWRSEGRGAARARRGVRGRVGRGSAWHRRVGGRRRQGGPWPVEQMLRLVVPGLRGQRPRHRSVPFADELPGFFEYLAAERGLRPASIASYQHHLRHFEAYLARIGVGRSPSSRRRS